MSTSEGKTPKNIAETLLIGLFLLSVFFLGVKKIGDADAWIHLSHGKLISGLRALPENEMFVYPSLDRPFSYSSWLFGLICHWVYVVFDAPGLVLFKAAVIAAAFAFLLRDSLGPVRNVPLAVSVLAAAAFFSKHRFVLRPEIFQMLFLAVTLYCLNEYLSRGRKYIYILPLVHLLWANMHSSISLMFATFPPFIAGGLLERLLGRSEAPSMARIRTIGIVFLLSLAASLINPNFSYQFFFGYEQIANEWAKDEVFEFLPPSGLTRSFVLAFGILTLASFALNRRRFSLVNLLIVIPFFYMSLMAVRFSYFIAFVGGPVIIRNVSEFIRHSGIRLSSLCGKTVLALAAVILAVLPLVPPGGAPKIEFDYSDFGLGFDYSKIPEAALEYMDANNIYGRVLNEPRFGQYIAWKSYPRRTVFIDCRWYIPMEMLEKSLKFCASKEVLNDLYLRYGFDSILINTLTATTCAGKESAGAFEPEWALVYWDDTAALYLKRGGKYADVIQRDEYRHVKLVPPDQIGRTTGGNNTEVILAELERNIRETGSSLAYLYLGLMYSSQGRDEDSIAAFNNVKPNRSCNIKVVPYEAIGNSYLKLGDFDKGIDFYKRYLAGMGESSHILYKIGSAYFSKGDYKSALRYALRAEKKGKTAEIYNLLARIHRKLGNTAGAEKAERAYSELLTGAVKDYYSSGVRAYSDKNYGLAIVELTKAVLENPSDLQACVHLGYAYLDAGKMDEAVGAFDKALSLDSENPDAHYGIGLIYKSRGDSQAAIKHFRAYLKKEPRGRTARAVRKQIDKLSKE